MTNYYIAYYPQIAQELGSPTAAAIMARMEYWFEKYSTEFYKFLEPCDHPCYKEGDSWCEEMGVSRRTFNRAFDLIGVRYKSKSDFLKASDPFDGKLYASYHDRKENRTHFVRNRQFLSDFFKDLLAFFKSAVSGLGKKVGALSNICRSRNDTYGRSYAYANKDIQNNTSSSKDQVQISNPQGRGVETVLESTLQEKMISFWKKRVGELGPYEPSKLHKLLAEVFDEKFNQDFSKWEAFCEQINSSDFLMGRKNSEKFKGVWITWALKPENTDKILKGFYANALSKDSQMDVSVQDLLQEWEEKIGGLEDLSSNDFIKKQLQKTYLSSFGGVMSNWKAYCAKIASSKFLMGEEKKAKSFQKIHIAYALKPETIEKINEGYYTTGDRMCLKAKEAFVSDQKVQSQDLIGQIAKKHALTPEHQGILESMVRGGGDSAFVTAFGDLESFKLEVYADQKRLEIIPQNSFSRFLQERFVRRGEQVAGWTVKIGG